MVQGNENLLKKNTKSWAIFSIISNAKIENRPVLGWKIVAGKKVTVEVIFHIIRKFRNEIVVRAVGPLGKKNLGNLAAGAQKLNFYLPDELVLFQSSVKQIEENGDIRVEIPSVIAQIDRRRDLRLLLENSNQVELEFSKENHGVKKRSQTFKKSCYDISAGGVSFIVSKSEKDFFKAGDIVKRLDMKIDNKILHLNSQVINIFEIEPTPHNGLIYKGWKVCLYHLSLDPGHKRLIEDFVFKYIDFDEAI